MTKNLGYSTDLTLAWIEKAHGNEWSFWRQNGIEWLASAGEIQRRLFAMKHLIEYLSLIAPYVVDPKLLFVGSNGHKVSTEEFIRYMKRSGDRGDTYLSRIINALVEFIDFVIEKNFLVQDDHGGFISIVKNPFTRINRPPSYSETVKTPLPYCYILQLREILCPYKNESESQEPWKKHHFRDWEWAIQNIGGTKGQGWIEVDESAIDYEDPDCVWRIREPMRQKSDDCTTKRKVTVYEIWSPVEAMILFTKLHLPLRTYQVRLLDSGEADTWRFEGEKWLKNYHDFSCGNEKRPYSKGVFRRIYDSYTNLYSTGLYVSTNKSADQNKEEFDRGYVIPWNHHELLYWLEKLRNWQEKYNPISGPISAKKLQKKHLGNVKSTAKKSEMGDFCFLFRNAAAKGIDKFLPLDHSNPLRSWYQLLKKLEVDLAKSGQILNDGTKLKFVMDYPEGTSTVKMYQTYFPLHSIRVSLITCYVMETELPLPVISKLLAGHTRLLMTIYYTKITPGMMCEKMEEAHAMLSEKSKESLRIFLKDAELSQIQAKSVYNSEESVIAAISNRNPIGWEPRAYGLCLVGGNTVRSDEVSTVCGCWNGGPLFRDNGHFKVHEPVPHGPENCPRCRFFITDASYLPELIAHANQLSYQTHQAAMLANEIDKQLEELRDEEYIAQEQNLIFSRIQELKTLQRRSEKQRVEADEYVKDYIAVFNIIKRIFEIENSREENDYKQKFIATGSEKDIKPNLKFVETDSELFHLSLLCEDAEFYPDLYDNLIKTPAFFKRSQEISRMLLHKGYTPIFLELDEKSRLIVENAIFRKIAMLSNSNNKMEGFRLAANYIETQEYLADSKLLDECLYEINSSFPIQLRSIENQASLM